jgi:hypothetical protein
LNSGTRVTFTHRGTTLEGRIFGAELVDDWRRGRGWHYVIRTDDYQLIQVRESQIAGVVEVAIP